MAFIKAVCYRSMFIYCIQENSYKEVGVKAF